MSNIIQDIEDEINQEIKRFYNASYAGKLPADFIELYKKAIPNVVPSLIDQTPQAQKVITEKKVNELSVVEVLMVFNAIAATKPSDLGFTELNEAYWEKQFELSECRKAYHKTSNGEYQKLQEKKNARTSLATGNSGGIPRPLAVAR